MLTLKAELKSTCCTLSALSRIKMMGVVHAKAELNSTVAQAFYLQGWSWSLDSNVTSDYQDAVRAFTNVVLKIWMEISLSLLARSTSTLRRSRSSLYIHRSRIEIANCDLRYNVRCTLLWNSKSIMKWRLRWRYSLICKSKTVTEQCGVCERRCQIVDKDDGRRQSVRLKPSIAATLSWHFFLVSVAWIGWVCHKDAKIAFPLYKTNCSSTIRPSDNFESNRWATHRQAAPDLPSSRACL